MPPRRSSRAPSVAAAEPEVLPGKRKRGSTVDPEAQAPAATEASKPPSRARRSTSAKPTPAPTARKSSRSKATLPDVPESGDEEHLEAPPVKKARPSIESVDVKEEEQEEEVEAPKPRRGRRAASVASEIEQPASKPASRRTSTRSAAVSSGSRVSAASGRSAGTSSSAMIVEEDEEEEEAPPPKARGKGKASKRAASKAVEVDDDDEEHQEEPEAAPSEDEYEEEVVSKPARKGRQPKAATATARKGKGKAAAPKDIPKVTIEDSDDNEEEFMQPVPPLNRTPLRTPKPSQAPPASQLAVPAGEEEEEKSLIDPPPIPAPVFSQPVVEEPKGPKSRLVIHKMALVNFKSYAGRQEIGPFHKSFSAIVGPNGSGKSNTIDALLFVFGYRASKMRQGKVSELIHNSANYPDLEDCSVEVHFRDIIDLPGPDAFKVVPNSSLIVTRTAYKNNSSKYTINDKNSSYAEVQTLLKGRGIDLDHNRFLILQGEVESIAQMKPKGNDSEDGLLEYLEDIIGTSSYKQPIEDASVKLEELNEERQVKLNRLRHVEKEKNALVERKKEAENYLRLKNEYVRALSRHWQWILWRAFDQENKHKAELADLEGELKAEREKNEGDLKRFEELQEDYANQEKAYRDVERAATAAVKELAGHEREEISLQERRKHASGRAKKLTKSVNEETKAKQEAERTIKDSADKIKKEKSALEKHEVDLETEEEKLAEIQESLKDKTQVFQDKINVKQRELDPWTTKIAAKQSEIDVALSERDALAKKAEALKAQCDEADATLKALQEEIGPKVEHQTHLKNEKGKLSGKIQAAEQKIQEAQARVNEWKGKASISRSKVDEARSNQSENRTRNAILDSLNRLRDTGKMPGFHGRLGNLGTIPDKYDVAISTSCGASLNHLVVDKVSEAQQCIEHLRRNNLGRANFTVLEKIDKRVGQVGPIPENAPRLFDLVQAKDPKFSAAFYKAMGDTIVATDIEQANRIAFNHTGKRFRVVSLDGGLIERSGAMSGGGNAVSRGAMSSKFAAPSVSPQVLREYEQDSEKAMKELQKATQELRDAESELEDLKSRGPRIDLDYQKLGMEIENMKARIAQAEKRVRELGAQNKPNAGDLSRISNLEKAAAAAQKELDKLTGQSAQIEQDIKDLQKKIMGIGGSKLMFQKSKVESVQNYIKIANDAITQAEVNKTKAEKDVVKLTTTIEKNSAALQEATGETQSLEQEILELQAYVEELTEKVALAQEAAESEKEELQKQKAELDEKETQIAAFRKIELELQQGIGDVKKDLAKQGQIIDEYSSKHEKLRLEDIDDDDEEEEEEAGAAEDKGEGTSADAAAEEEPAQEEDNEDEGNEDAEVKQEGDAQGSKKKAAAKPATPAHVLKQYGDDELRKFKQAELLADVVHLDEQIKKMKPDMAVLKEYRQREEEFLNRAKDLDNISAERDTQKDAYERLRKQRHDEFMDGFRQITQKVKEMYQMITIGGNAELEAVDTFDPFSEGIIFSVMPPKKSWKNISNLSGGEKTLSSLALVFALHHFKPTPLYFMDEIDAALDFRNVSIIANYIKDRTKDAQFIIISLRNDMFELSHRLIGIYKTSNATRTVTIDNHALQTTIPRNPAPPPSTAPPSAAPQSVAAA